MVMLEYAHKLTTSPCGVEKADIDRVREAGFGDAHILAIVQVSAYFNFVNRLACGLGVELEGHLDES